MQKAENEEILRKILHAIGDVPKNVYSPSDDTFLMLDAIAKISVGGKQVLDIGTGSGILGLFCASRGAHVTVTDVDQSALEYAQKTARVLALGLQTVLSDVFSNVQGKFDLVTFNPPYLPSSTVEDRTVDGGPGGIALSKRFLGGLGEHLNCDGTALLLISTLNDSASLISEVNPEFQYEVMAKRQLFFEELQVLSVRFRDSLAC
ncbi:MAG: HemK2/MTQ2 family protein methyltransferase [Candidatus Bathyarchaeia archaeon]